MRGRGRGRARSRGRGRGARGRGKKAVKVRKLIAFSNGECNSIFLNLIF